MQRYLTEFIGTFFLVFTIGLTAGNSLAPLAIGAILMAMVYMGGHISGAHYNPAVSLAVLLRGKLSALDFIPYVVFQVGGALAASYLVLFLTKKLTVPVPDASVVPVTAILIEAIFTFALALVVLNVATAKGTEGNSYYGLAIGFTYLAAVLTGGPISGGAFNPAVGVGPIAIQYWFQSGGLDYVGFYIIGPFLGGAVAAVVFTLQNVSWTSSQATAESRAS
jgi:aquaporin Z